MCVICISPKGIRQPNKEEIEMMWKHNPHGAGYMFVNSDGLVEIHKGFMECKEYIRAIESEGFTESDLVVYHLRIATQGGVNPEMTHPFPLTAKIENTKLLDVACPVGIVHNGIIPCTTSHGDEYSDTARFIVEYLAPLVTCENDFTDPHKRQYIESLLQSKMAVLDEYGNLTTYGHFTTDENGLMYSNMYWRPVITKYDVNLFDRSTWTRSAGKSHR